MPGRQALEHDVLADREARHEVPLLVHGADAGGDRVARRGEADLAAVDGHPPLVGLVDAGDDLDQRRLAGAVLAHQRMDLAGPKVERDAVERLDAGEGFARGLDREAHLSPSPSDRAPAVEPDRGEDQRAEEELDPVRVDLGEHHAVLDQGDQHHREHGAEDRDVAAGQRRAADDRGGKGQEQPVGADGRLGRAELRHGEHRGAGGERARQHMGEHDHPALAGCRRAAPRWHCRHRPAAAGRARCG